ncbi:MAG TPA: hypothetical protein VGA97_04660, partial [Acidimicrobiia bacterium]
IVALDLSGGTEKWRSAGTWPLTVVPRGGLLAATESPYGDVAADILLIDPETGAAIVFYEADPTVGIPEGAAFVRDGTVIVTTRFGLRGFDFGGTFLWSWNSLSPVVDLAAFANGFAAMPTADRSVVALTLP